jgi:probable rRNA maturation factor
MVTFIKNSLFSKKLNIDCLIDKSQKALKQLNIPESEVTIVLDSNIKLKELNNLYLGIDEITDVLSFYSGDSNPETGNIYLGDIIISLEKAADQAKDKSHSLEFEVLTLIVHGVLHLLDYDHLTKPDATAMFGKQDEILGAINKQ